MKATRVSMALIRRQGTAGQDLLLRKMKDDTYELVCCTITRAETSRVALTRALSEQTGDSFSQAAQSAIHWHSLVEVVRQVCIVVFGYSIDCANIQVQPTNTATRQCLELVWVPISNIDAYQLPNSHRVLIRNYQTYASYGVVTR